MCEGGSFAAEFVSKMEEMDVSLDLTKAVKTFRANLAKVRTSSGVISFMMTAGKTFLTRYIYPDSSHIGK